MNIRLLLVGKTEESYLKQGIQIYSDRLSHYCKFSIVEIPELKNAKALSREQIKEKEGELILKNISPADELILLNERGKMYTSVEWASQMEKKFLQCIKILSAYTNIRRSKFQFPERITVLSERLANNSKY